MVVLDAVRFGAAVVGAVPRFRWAAVAGIGYSVVVVVGAATSGRIAKFIGTAIVGVDNSVVVGIRVSTAV